MKLMILLKNRIHADNNINRIFWPMLKISATTFGGGFVIVPLLKSKYVDEEHIIDEDEMLDLMAIAQSSPGPIAVNASIMVGYRIAGLPGGLIALLATVIPPLVIISIISLIYEAFRDNNIVRTLMRGMLCGVSAVIINVVIQMTNKLGKKIVPYIVLALSFALSYLAKVNIILILLMAAVTGLIFLYYEKRKSKSIKANSDNKIKVKEEDKNKK